MEVSIDGARGILFNVIGGNDLSMHEINAAAEAITTAADPDANIIFGATINPELEGEVIITVVATGFDASYFAKRGAESSRPARSTPKFSETRTTKQEEKTLSEIDMDLGDDQDKTASDFHRDDTPMPNIWSINDDDDDDKDKGSAKTDDSDSDSDEANGADSDGTIIGQEDDLDKPSFLRRLGRRHKDDEDGQPPADEPTGE